MSESYKPEYKQGEPRHIMEIKMIHLPFSNRNNIFASYRNQLEPQYRFSSDELREIYETNKDFLLHIVEKELYEYINNDDLCNDSDDMFPKRSVLSGEWYVSNVYFDENDLMIQTNLLGMSSGDKDDYLGLEVVFGYNRGITGCNKDKDEFCVLAVNSSPI